MRRSAIIEDTKGCGLWYGPRDQKYAQKVKAKLGSLQQGTWQTQVPPSPAALPQNRNQGVSPPPPRRLSCTTPRTQEFHSRLQSSNLLCLPLPKRSRSKITTSSDDGVKSQTHVEACETTAT